MQEMQPSLPVPPPLGLLLKQMVGRQLREVFEDFQREASCINAGAPTLQYPTAAAAATPPEVPQN